MEVSKEKQEQLEDIVFHALNECAGELSSEKKFLKEFYEDIDREVDRKAGFSVGKALNSGPSLLS